MKRFAELDTPLGSELSFVHLSASEALSEPFVLHITAASRGPDVDFQRLLGEHATVRMSVSADLQSGPRCFDGLVEQVSALGRHAGSYLYQIVARPWFWFLTRTQDCRIFQNQTVLEIIDEVLADHAIAVVDRRTTAAYTPWVYCVQYRESDFDFLSRLMEQEGIWYFFTHEAGKHTLVLADATSACPPCAGARPLPVRHADAGSAPGSALWELTPRQRVASGAMVLRDYDFTRPQLDLQLSSRKPASHTLADHEVFDYPGLYDQTGDGEQFVGWQMEAMAAAARLTSAQSNAPLMACGGLFTVRGSPRAADNIEYLVQATQISVEQPSAEAGSEGNPASNPGYHCQLQAVDASVPWRSPRKTPKPVVQGPQTAVVVGPAGDEIHTDSHGRVKVQFHWDRYGQKNEKSSCWVRVASPWAGKNFGFVQVPRVGQEVIVDFLEGDPDQPIVTGRVYNAQNMPPWELPANATQSGVLTRSSKGGAYANANAIRFEDKKGEEQLWIHAERNQDNEVENDETTDIGRDRTEHVGRHETVTIDGNHVETVKLAKAETIFLAKALSIGLGYQTSVGAAMNTTVALGQFAQIGHSKTTDVGQHYDITAGDSFSVTVGKARLTMTKDGKVTIVGSQFLFDASGPVQINGKDIDLN